MRPSPIRPAPGAYPVVGHVPAYLSDRLTFFSGCRNGSGAVVRCRLGTNAYLLNDPEDIRHVLATSHDTYVKARRLAGARAAWRGGQGLLTSTGVEHRRKRRMLQPIFRQPLLDRLVAVARGNVERVLMSWGDGAEVDVAAAMMALARRNILETLFDSPSERWLDELTAATRARRRFVENVYFSLFPLPEYLPTRTNLAYLRGMRRIDRGIYRAIEARRTAVRRPADMLSMLLDATDEDGRSMSDRQLRDEILTFALTGHETVGEALAWTFLLLAEHPEADEALARELGSNGDGTRPTSYAARVVRESMRLFPPTWIYARIAGAEDVLPSGARIPRGATLYLSPYVTHRNPRFWPDPERFDPDRFLPEANDGRPRHAYFPFGSGPHVCIGETLALAQILTVLATVVPQVRLTLAQDQNVVPDPGLTLRPKGGLTMRVEQRS